MIAKRLPIGKQYNIVPICASYHTIPPNSLWTQTHCSGKALAECCIELFIHNVIIIRPITPVGRQKLHADTLHLETALRPMVEDISSFGRPYR